MTEWNPEDEHTRRLPGDRPQDAEHTQQLPPAPGTGPSPSQGQPYGQPYGRPPGQPPYDRPAGQGQPHGQPQGYPQGMQHRYGEHPGGFDRGPDRGAEAHRDRVGGFTFGNHDNGSARRTGIGAGLVAALLVAALVVGGIAGLVGAAGFNALRHDDATTSSGTATSPVVNSAGSGKASASSAEAVAKAVLPSVVKINVTGSSESGSGSGIIISSDGEILTNNHVASVAGNGGEISVNFNDGSAKKARIIGADPVTDLAVIKAENVSGLRPATIGKSTDVAVGENVVAIGSPFGLQATVTSGIVSALNRPVSVSSAEEQPQDPFGGGQSQQGGNDTTYPAIQTDAAINPGNSGGPLVDMSGRVIGINSSIRTASSGGLDDSSGGSIGLGFAIPIDNVWPVVQQLRNGEKATHAQMGVSVSDASSQNGLLTGAGVQSVTGGSAAQQAGLRKGDVITKVDDDVITGSESLVATVRGHRPGDKVELTVVRNDKTRTLAVTLDSDAKS